MEVTQEPSSKFLIESLLRSWFTIGAVDRGAENVLRQLMDAAIREARPAIELKTQNKILQYCADRVRGMTPGLFHNDTDYAEFTATREAMAVFLEGQIKPCE